MQHLEPTGGDDSMGKNIARAVSQGFVCIEGEYSEGKLDKGSGVCIIGGNTTKIHNQASPSQPSVSGKLFVMANLNSVTWKHEIELVGKFDSF